MALVKDMSGRTCRWKAKYTSYKCEEPVFDQKSNHCIIHIQKEEKLSSFIPKIVERINAPEKIDLVGCYFPKKFPPNYFQRDGSNKFAGKLLDFREATFSQIANFDMVQNPDVAIKATTLEVDFGGATFLQEVNFYNVEFERACFNGAKFLQRVYFNRATFLEEVY